jgi:hypothetical protein
MKAGVLPNAMATPCNGQKPCVEMHLGSAYTAPSVKLLCLFDRDFEQKPQIFCGPAQAQTAKFVSITAARIEIDRISGGHVKTLYSVKR